MLGRICKGGVIGMSVLLLVAGALPAAAENETKAEKKEELPKSGVLSRSGTAGGGRKSTTVAMPWGGVDQASQSTAPIAGSVSKISAREWKAFIVNNSEDTYEVDVRVVQLDKRGTQVKTDSFSYTLKPKQAVERMVAATFSTMDAQLMLERWKLLSAKKKEAPQNLPQDVGEAPGGANPNE